MENEQKELAKVIEKYFGADAAYLDIDVFTLAKRIMEAGWTRPVRCKGCKYQGTAGCPTYYEDSMTYRDSWALDGDNDFCSYGEKKDGDDDA